MLKAIVGIAIEVTQWSGKWKVSQNQTAANRAGVAAALGQSPDAQAQAMAALVQGP
jgi:transcriptional regulator